MPAQEADTNGGTVDRSVDVSKVKEGKFIFMFQVNVKLLRLLCLVVLGVQNGEFQRFIADFVMVFYV